MGVLETNTEEELRNTNREWFNYREKKLKEELKIISKIKKERAEVKKEWSPLNDMFMKGVQNDN